MLLVFPPPICVIFALNLMLKYSCHLTLRVLSWADLVLRAGCPERQWVLHPWRHSGKAGGALSTDGTVGTPVHRRGLDLMVFNGSFQLKWFYVPYFSPSTKMFLILLHRLKLLQMHSALLWASCESVSTTAQDSKGGRWRLRSFPPSSFPR